MTGLFVLAADATAASGTRKRFSIYRERWRNNSGDQTQNHFSQNKQTNQVVLERRRCGSSSYQHLAKNKLVTESTAACGLPEAAAPAGEQGFPTMHKNIRIHIISFEVPSCVLNTPPRLGVGGNLNWASSCVKITKIGVILLSLESQKCPPDPNW